MGSIISGTGSTMPRQVVKNEYFSNVTFYKKDGSKDPKPATEIVKKLEEISGIKERRFIGEDESSIEILFDASKKAIADASIPKNDLDAIIVAHNSGNMLANKGQTFHTCPNVAAILKNKLEIINHQCIAYDILFGCPGWLQAVIQANRLISIGDATHVLVVGLEVASRMLDPHDVDSMLMADGCGATIISKSNIKDIGVLASATFSHAQDDLHNITLGPSLNKEIPGECYFKMNGQKVYRYGTTWVPKVIKKAMDKVDISPKDVDYFFFHQANEKMLKVIASNLMKLYDIEDENFQNKIPMSINFLGNTSVATIPTLLDLVNKNKIEGFKLEKNQTYVFASVGAGMHCNALIYKS